MASKSAESALEPIEVNGLHFERTKLDGPFGERWKRTEGGVLVDEWVMTEPGRIITEVRRAKLIALENTQTYVDWHYVHRHQDSDLLQATDLGTSGEVAFTHSVNGQAPDSIYTTDQLIGEAILTHERELIDLLEQAPDDIKKERYFELVKHFMNRDGLRFLASTILGALRSIYRATNIAYRRSVGDDRDRGDLIMRINDGIDRTDLVQKYESFREFFFKLRTFYADIVKTCQKTRISWQQNPALTVLSDHNQSLFPIDIDEEGPRDIIYECRELVDDLSGREEALRVRLLRSRRVRDWLADEGYRIEHELL